MKTKNYELAQMDEITPTRCPCGFARRAFVSPENRTATLHITDIASDSAVHYHKVMTELYLVLEGTGFMELDGERVPLKPMTSIFIKPGCRHRAVQASGHDRADPRLRPGGRVVRLNPRRRAPHPISASGRRGNGGRPATAPGPR